MSDPIQASRTALITGRGHSPAEIYAGFKYLQSRKYIKYVPSINHIYPVMEPLDSNWSEIPLRKMKVIESILFKIPKNSQFMYSDDDAKNMKFIRRTILYFKRKKWPNKEVILIKTQ